MSDTKSRPDAGDTYRCSFCGKTQREVRKLIAGPTVYICDGCIGLGLEVIDAPRPLSKLLAELDTSAWPIWVGPGEPLASAVWPDPMDANELARRMIRSSAPRSSALPPASADAGEERDVEMMSAESGQAPRARCSFCAKSVAEVRRLVRAGEASICNECLVLCWEILEEDLSDEHQGTAARADGARGGEASGASSGPTPDVSSYYMSSYETSSGVRALHRLAQLALDVSAHGFDLLSLSCVRLRLVGVGRGDQIENLDRPKIGHEEGASVSLTHGSFGVVEDVSWTPEGFAHHVRVNERPPRGSARSRAASDVSDETDRGATRGAATAAESDDDPQPLVLVFTIEGNLRVDASARGRLLFETPTGLARAVQDVFSASDRQSRTLQTDVRSHDRHPMLLVTIDDASATYPITVEAG